jgi:hypothetical protein
VLVSGYYDFFSFLEFDQHSFTLFFFYKKNLFWALFKNFWSKLKITPNTLSVVHCASFSLKVELGETYFFDEKFGEIAPDFSTYVDSNAPNSCSAANTDT